MPEPVYFPRRLGILTPRGESIYEVVVVGEDKVGSLDGVLKIFAKHFVNLIYTTAYDSTAAGDFMLNTYADMSRVDANAAQVRREIGSLPYVKSVRMEAVNSSRFSRFLFPIIITGQSRVMIFGAAALAAIEKRMVEGDEDRGRSVLVEAGRSAGLEVSREMRRYLPWGDKESLVAAASDQLRAYGWGIFDFDTASIRRGTVRVRVGSPAFAGIPGATGSWLLIGIASGVLEGSLGFASRLNGKPSFSPQSSEFKFELATWRPGSGKRPG